MQVASTYLPSDSINAISSKMSNQINHTELCQWLTAVAKQRDKKAFTHLFKFFGPKIQRIAIAKVNTETQANEVVQETMSNVWRKAHLFDGTKGAATTWVYTIMRNVTFDMLRKVKSNKEDTLSDDIWSLAEAENIQYSDFTDHLASKNLRSVIENLPENQQQVIKAYYFMEMSQDQLAVHLNLPLGTIKSRLRLALGKLKVQLGESHD
jgi:RNA polymerase sigma-70 factor (ECF subfamily)